MASSIEALSVAEEQPSGAIDLFSQTASVAKEPIGACLGAPSIAKNLDFCCRIKPVAQTQPSESSLVLLRSKSVADEALQKHVTRNQTSKYIIWLALVLVFGLGLDVFEFKVLLFREVFSVHCPEAFMFDVFFKLRLLLLCVVPLMEDVLVTRVLVTCHTVVVTIENGSAFYYNAFSGIAVCQGKLVHVQRFVVYQAWYYSRGVLFIMFGLWTLIAPSFNEGQKRVWCVLGVTGVCDVIHWAICVVYLAARAEHYFWHLVFLLSSILPLCIAVNPRLRKKVQGLATTWMDSQASLQRATNLAAGIGSVPPAEALGEARRHFRCMKHCQLAVDVEAHTDSAPRAALAGLARPCALGSCDAYISHAAHDGEQAKWIALDSWAAAFKGRCRRDPLLWLDQFCFVEQDLETQLRCLPIFLKGCKRLVVLCGPIYFSCLWASLELFTYVYLGGCVADIELVQVLREGSELEDAQAIENAFYGCDVWDCPCCESKDKQRILATIESVSGSLEVFNSTVKGIIEQLRMQLCEQSALMPIASAASRTPRTPDTARVCSTIPCDGFVRQDIAASGSVD